MEWKKEYVRHLEWIGSLVAQLWGQPTPIGLQQLHGPYNQINEAAPPSFFVQIIIPGMLPIICAMPCWQTSSTTPQTDTATTWVLQATTASQNSCPAHGSQVAHAKQRLQNNCHPHKTLTEMNATQACKAHSTDRTCYSGR